jgi:hypothetical protein
MILVLPTPLVIVQDINGDIVVGRPFSPVEEGEKSAAVVKGFSLYDGSVPNPHADPVSGLQFVYTFKGHAHPSTPVKLLSAAASLLSRAVMDLMIRPAATSAQPQHVRGRPTWSVAN